MIRSQVWSKASKSGAGIIVFWGEWRPLEESSQTPAVSEEQQEEAG